MKRVDNNKDTLPNPWPKLGGRYKWRNVNCKIKNNKKDNTSSDMHILKVNIINA